MRLPKPWFLIFFLIPYLISASNSNVGMQSYQDLIIETVEEGACPDPEGLSAKFAFYGIQCLDQSYLDLIGQDFQLFSPMLVESQRPPRAPDRWTQVFFQQAANLDQRRKMVSTLRIWFEGEWPEVKSHNMVLKGNESVGMLATVHAAECLFAWGDYSSKKLIQAYLDKKSLSVEMRDRFEELVERFESPCSRSLFRILPNGLTQSCHSPGSMGVVTAIPKGPKPQGRSLNFELSNEELEQFSSLLTGAKVGPVRKYIGGAHLLRVRLENGYVCEIRISPESENIQFSGREPRHTQQVELISEELYNWSFRLFKSED